jgi:hypothetical protein
MPHRDDDSEFRENQKAEGRTRVEAEVQRLLAEQEKTQK